MTTTTAMSPPTAHVREARAILASRNAGFFSRLGMAARGLYHLMRNTEDTEQVFVVAAALNARRAPTFMARFLEDDRGLALLESRAAIDSASVDFEALRALPADTLGGAYARFLDTHGLDPDLFQAPPGLPVASGYIAQRMRQTHDIWHVVTGYTPAVEGELAVLAFTYAQTGMPSAALISALGTLRFCLKIRGLVGRVRQAYRRGKATPFLGNVAWEEMWTWRLDTVRSHLGVAPITAR